MCGIGFTRLSLTVVVRLFSSPIGPCGAGRYPQPIALLDVITRVASLSDAIGCRGLLVHAESEQDRGFYEHLIQEFGRSPSPVHRC